MNQDLNPIERFFMPAGIKDPNLHGLMRGMIPMMIISDIVYGCVADFFKIRLYRILSILADRRQPRN